MLGTELEEAGIVEGPGTGSQLDPRTRSGLSTSFLKLSRCMAKPQPTGASCISLRPARNLNVWSMVTKEAQDMIS